MGILAENHFDLGVNLQDVLDAGDVVIVAMGENDGLKAQVPLLEVLQQGCRLSAHINRQARVTIGAAEHIGVGSHRTERELF